MSDHIRGSSVPSYEDLDAASSTRSDTDEFAVYINSAVARVGEYNLAVTGEVFQWMLEFASDDSFNRVTGSAHWRPLAPLKLTRVYDSDARQRSNLRPYVA